MSHVTNIRYVRESKPREGQGVNSKEWRGSETSDGVIHVWDAGGRTRRIKDLLSGVDYIGSIVVEKKGRGSLRFLRCSAARRDNEVLNIQFPAFKSTCRVNLSYPTPKVKKGG